MTEGAAEKKDKAREREGLIHTNLSHAFEICCPAVFVFSHLHEQPKGPIASCFVGKILTTAPLHHVNLLCTPQEAT